MKRAIPRAYQDYLADRGTSTSLSGDGRPGLSWRAFWTGAFLSFLLAIGAPYANTAMHATFMAWDFNTPGAIFLFLVLIGPLNALFKVAARDVRLAAGLAVLATVCYLGYYLPLESVDVYTPGFWFITFLVLSALIDVPVVAAGGSLALNRAELVLVYVMLLMVSALCTMGMSEQLLPIITAFFYYAAPENKWAEKLLPHFPDYPLLVDDGSDNQAFYEGVGASGAHIPYSAWVEPLVWWSIFLLALYAAMISIAVILRRQWMERERLAYPLTQVGMAMVEGEEEKGLVNAFFRSRAVWWGMAVPMLFGSLRALHHYDPAVPAVDLSWNFSLFETQGLIAGEVLCNGLWIVIDYFTGKTGNMVFILG